jgi:hypothetical protein
MRLPVFGLIGEPTDIFVSKRKANAMIERGEAVPVRTRKRVVIAIKMLPAAMIERSDPCLSVADVERSMVLGPEDWSEANKVRWWPTIGRPALRHAQ